MGRNGDGQPVATKDTPPEPFALDGKTARGSFDGLNKAVHLLSLLAHESGLTLAQRTVPDGGHDKTNEHKAALRLLEGLVLEGRLITGDALFCQRDLSQEILDRKGHYLWFVKENQPTLLEAIQTAFAPSLEGAFPPRQQQIWCKDLDTATMLNKGHGRCERRTLQATTALNDDLDGPGGAPVGRVESVVTREGKTTPEVRYFITSVSRRCADAGQWLHGVCGHGSIENRSHYVRGVNLGEDARRIRKGSGPEVMAAMMGNAAIGWLRYTGVTNIAASLRRNAARVTALFAKLGVLKQ
ncbi:hypothetical protein BH23PLA1_BH23PLA1_28160 [soil metagenome]